MPPDEASQIKVTILNQELKMVVIRIRRSDLWYYFVMATILGLANVTLMLRLIELSVNVKDRDQLITVENIQ